MDNFIFKHTPEYESACVTEILERGMFLYMQESEGEQDISNLSIYDIECYFCYLGYKLAMDTVFASMPKVTKP